MKKWTMLFNQNDRINFDLLKNGTKTIETRAATVKYRGIKKGDILIFSCGKEKIEKEIVEVKHFSTIDALFETYPIERVMPSIPSLKQAKEIYYSYPKYEEKIAHYGLFAFVLK